MGKSIRCESCNKSYRTLRAIESLRDNDSICVECDSAIEVEDWDEILESWDVKVSEEKEDPEEEEEEEDEEDEEEKDEEDEELDESLDEEDEEEDEDLDEEEDEEEDEDEDFRIREDE